MDTCDLVKAVLDIIIILSDRFIRHTIDLRFVGRVFTTFSELRVLVMRLSGASPSDDAHFHVAGYHVCFLFGYGILGETLTLILPS